MRNQKEKFFVVIRTINYGYFDTIEEALKVRDAELTKLGAAIPDGPRGGFAKPQPKQKKEVKPDSGKWFIQAYKTQYKAETRKDVPWRCVRIPVLGGKKSKSYGLFDTIPEAVQARNAELKRQNRDIPDDSTKKGANVVPKSKEHHIYERSNGKWTVSLKRKGKQSWNGTFDTLDEAVKVRDQKMKELGYDDLASSSEAEESGAEQSEDEKAMEVAKTKPPKPKPETRAQRKARIAKSVAEGYEKFDAARAQWTYHRCQIWMEAAVRGVFDMEGYDVTDMPENPLLEKDDMYKADLEFFDRLTVADHFVLVKGLLCGNFRNPEDSNWINSLTALGSFAEDYGEQWQDKVNPKSIVKKWPLSKTWFKDQIAPIFERVYSVRSPRNIFPAV